MGMRVAEHAVCERRSIGRHARPTKLDPVACSLCEEVESHHRDRRADEVLLGRGDGTFEKVTSVAASGRAPRITNAATTT